MTKQTKQSTSDRVLLAALAAGMSHAAAARAASISERTVRRRVLEPEFAAQLTQVRDEHVAQLSHRLMGLVPAALDTLTELLAPEKPSGVRLRAASILLATGRIWRDAIEIENRVRALEEQAFTEPNGLQ